MTPVTIGHMADTHLGYRALTKADPVTGRNQRTVDIENAFAWAIDDMIERQVDLVVHSGDLFHHTRPVYPAIATAIRQFRKLEQAGIPAYIVAGNHDTPRLRVSGSVFGLLESALPGITVCGGYEEALIEDERNDLLLTLVPHGRMTNPEPPAVFPVEGRRNILVVHGLVPNMGLPYQMHEPGEEEISEILLDSAFDYIALGHYHPFSQVRNNAWYAGSTERITWRDEPIAPGYAIATLGDVGAPATVEHIQNPHARPMVTYDFSAGMVAELDGKAIAEHLLQWMELLAEPTAMTRIVMKDIPRPVRRHAEALIRMDADGLVWSVEVTGAGIGSSPFVERGPGMPSANLLELFTAFIAEGQETNQYDESFAASFAEIGRRELEQAQIAIDALVTAEGAE
ncbi:MAG: DNA repair exonuclease [Thermomicrobiales bacterium]|nr:DNA repair exonuclease [Thermomicrobiales bacterium]